MKKNLSKVLKRYTTPGDPIAFSSRNVLKRILKKNVSDVNKDVLSYNYSYPLHRSTKRPNYNPYVNIRYPRQQIQCDLLDVSKFANSNQGVRNLLVCIDCFSRFIWVKPLKTKTAVEVVSVFKELIEEWSPELPKQLTVDQGLEFRNSKFKQLMQLNNIKIFHPTSEGKAVYVERVNQTLQLLIYRYLTEKQTRKYIDVLQDLVKTYNTRPHRSLANHPPYEAVKDENVHFFRRVEQNRIAPIVHKNLRLSRMSKNKFKVGDVVRIRKWKNVFDRGYKQTFSNLYYKIHRILDSLPTVTYELVSLHDNEVVRGGFYPNELQLVKGDIYKVEKVIKTERRKGKLRHFVKWLHFGNEHNSWVEDEDLIE
jgi:hypothetical protein